MFYISIKPEITKAEVLSCGFGQKLIILASGFVQKERIYIEYNEDVKIQLNNCKINFFEDYELNNDYGLYFQGPGKLFIKNKRPKRLITIENDVIVDGENYSELIIKNNCNNEIYKRNLPPGKFYVRKGKVLTEDEFMIKEIIE